jgi:diguanylate cyclase (GGDEF)-like protein/PAS domain S-box-containing protein
MSGDPYSAAGVSELRLRVAELEEELRKRRTGAESGLELFAGDDNAQIDNIFFRQLFENSPEAIVLLDLEDRVFDANRAFERIFDYSVEEARGQTINSLIVPEEGKEKASELSRKALSGGIIAAETVRRRKDGAPVEVTVLGYPIFQGETQIGIFGIYSDITVRRQFERKLRLQSAAMDSAVNSIFITDADGRIIWSNRAFANLSGYSPQEVVGLTPEFLAPVEDTARESLDPARWLHLRPREVWRAQIVNRSKSGELYTVEQTVTPLRDLRGEDSHFVVVQEDISERVRAQEQLHRMARHDFLTDLPNRYSFSEELKLELERAARTGGAIAVFVIDLDHFKDVNDTYGHPAGDDLLVAVSRRLRQTLRKSSTLARLGGDEFAIIQTDLEDPENARGLAMRVLTAFSEPFALRGQNVHASASLGISMCPPSEADARSLVKKADMAMYRAKSEGRGTFQFYEKEMDREVRQRMRLGQDLHTATENGELFLEYQPLISLDGNFIVGVEALARWQHPELGLVRPDQFIPIAEGSGLIIPIGAWVLETACAQAKTWSSEFDVDVPVAVNVSSIQFRDPHFVDTVKSVLHRTGLPPEQLQLELTEGTLMQATAKVEQALQSLGDLGIQLSLDDFGKGYSSLEYLRRLPLESLKIDRSFVQGVADNSPDPVIVSVVMALGKKLGLTVIAEGIETEEQCDFLSTEGCSFVQGFLFSRPLKPQHLEKLFEHGSDRIAPLRSNSVPRPSAVSV